MFVKSMYPAVSPLNDVNVHNILHRRPDQVGWPDFTLHIDAATGRRRTYRDFVERVYDGATALGTPVSEGGLGLRAEDGEIVGILAENCMDYITIVNSLLAIAVPFSLLSSYSTPFELEHALRSSDVTRLFVDPKLLSLALCTASKVGIPQSKIYVLEGHANGRRSFGDMIDNVKTNHISRLEVRPVKTNTLAYLVFSSGTSGLPKAVMISHGNIIYTLLQTIVMAREIAQVFTLPPKSSDGIPVGLAFLPLYHAYGLHTFCFRVFLQPTTLVLLRKWDVEQALSAIPKYKITTLTLIPSAIHQIVKYLKNHKVDLSSVQVMASGAAYLPSQLLEKLVEFAPKDSKFVEGYGMSELTVAALATAIPGMLGGRAKPVAGSQGILIPGMEARILRDDGSEATVNEPGNLYLKGDNIALGYWKNNQANKESFVDGWLQTGDRFRIDQDGNFFFEDRVKDTLKVSGMQVSPVEIENVLLLEPDKLIVDVTVAGVSGGRTTVEKIPRAWVILSDEGKKRGPAAVIKALEAWSQENLSKYKWLRGGIEVVDEIPKSPTGKVLRRVLQERYETSKRKFESKL